LVKGDIAWLLSISSVRSTSCRNGDGGFL